MTAPSGSPSSGIGRRVVGIVSATTLMAAGVLLVAQLRGRDTSVPPHPVAPLPTIRGAPIPSEALVFRADPTDFAVAPSAEPRTPAHRRTLETYRALRAYPGAPPSIPHGLTADEFRSTTCLGCHRRGGYTPRFAAYAPPSPHPEYSACLQCHLADSPRVGIELPTSATRESCGQCHSDPGAIPPTFVASDWRAPSWPTADIGTVDGGPPPVIPHELQLRGNCLACHAGPSAVEEIQTTHPERTNCRQCHLTEAPKEELFARPFRPTRSDGTL